MKEALHKLSAIFFIRNFFAALLMLVVSCVSFARDFSIRNLPGEVYQFTLMPAWEQAFMVTVQINENGTASLLYRTLPENNSIFLRFERAQLNESETLKFLNLLIETDFWNLPTDIDHLGLDGTTINFQGVKDGEFHRVNRWQPVDSVWKIEQFFLNLVEQKFLRPRLGIRHFVTL